jgi:hypothetical protein
VHSPEENYEAWCLSFPTDYFSFNNVYEWKVNTTMFCTLRNNPKIITRKSCLAKVIERRLKLWISKILFKTVLNSGHFRYILWIDHTWRKTNNVIGSVQSMSTTLFETNSIICRRGQCMWEDIVEKGSHSQFSLLTMQKRYRTTEEFNK